MRTLEEHHPTPKESTRDLRISSLTPSRRSTATLVSELSSNHMQIFLHIFFLGKRNEYFLNCLYRLPYQITVDWRPFLLSSGKFGPVLFMLAWFYMLIILLWRMILLLSSLESRKWKDPGRANLYFVILVFFCTDALRLLLNICIGMLTLLRTGLPPVSLIIRVLFYGPTWNIFQDLFVILYFLTFFVIFMLESWSKCNGLSKK